MPVKTIRLTYVVVIMLALAAVILMTGYCLGQVSGANTNGGSASNNTSIAALGQTFSSGGGQAPVYDVRPGSGHHCSCCPCCDCSKCGYCHGTAHMNIHCRGTCKCCSECNCQKAASVFSAGGTNATV